jgi:hypothetical protein
MRGMNRSILMTVAAMMGFGTKGGGDVAVHTLTPPVGHDIVPTPSFYPSPAE